MLDQKGCSRARLRATACILACVLVAASPGAPAYRAFAQTVVQVPAQQGSPPIAAGIPSAAPSEALGVSPSLDLAGGFNALPVVPDALAARLPGGEAAMPTVSAFQASPRLESASIQRPSEASSTHEIPPRTGAIGLLSEAGAVRLDRVLAEPQAAEEAERSGAPILGWLGAAAAEAPGLRRADAASAKVSAGAPFEGMASAVPALTDVPLIPHRPGLLGPAIAPPRSRVVVPGPSSFGRTARSVLPFAAALAVGLAAWVAAHWMGLPLGWLGGASLALLLGTMTDPGDSSREGVERFVAEIRDAVKEPGGQVTAKLLKRAADKLSMSLEEVHELMVQAAAQGRLVYLANAAILYVDLGGSDDPSGALKHAQEGIALLNERKEPGRALTELDEALKALAPGDARRRQIEILKANAALEVLRQSLKSRDDQPAKRALAHLRTVVIDLEHHRLIADARDLEILRGLADEPFLRELLDSAQPAPAKTPSANESDPRADRFLDALRKDGAKPGELLDIKRLVDVGRQAGLEAQSETWDLLGFLGRRGRLALFSNGTHIYVDLEQYSHPPSDERVYKALRLLSGDGGAPAAALALYHLDEAVSAYPAEHPNRRQVAVIRENTAIELLGQIRDEIDTRLASAGAQQAEGLDRDALDKLRAYAQEAYYDVGHARPMNKEELAAAKALLARFEPKEFDAFPESDGMKEGLAILHIWLDVVAAAEKGGQLVPIDPSRERFDDAVLKAIQGEYKPGERLSHVFLARLAKELKLGLSDIEASLARWAFRGRFAGFRKDLAIYLDLEAPAGAAPEIVQALQAARTGLTLYARKEVESRLRSLYFFHEALVHFDDWGVPRRQHHPLRRQIEVLINNTALDILRGDAVSVLRQPSRLMPWDKRRDGEMGEKLEEHLKKAFYDRTHTPDLLDVEVRKWLDEKYGTQALENSVVEDTENAIEIVRGLHAYRGFLANLDKDYGGRWKTRDESPAEVASPGPSEDQGRKASGEKKRLYPGAPRAEEFIPISGDDDRYKALNAFGENLTAKAKAGKLDPLIGRIPELRQVVEALKKRRKANPLLIGPKGTGKTQIVEGLAQLIADGDVPEHLQGVNIFRLDLGRMIAGTKYRGEFEERLKNVLKEAEKYGDKILLFVDETHTLLGAGGAEGAMDASNLLKPALARGELRMIGATTWDDWRRVEEHDGAMERRFQKIKVEPQDPKDALEILRGLQSRYEGHHKVRYQDEALEAAAEMAAGYVLNNHLPDSAIDIMDTAGGRVSLADPAERAALGRPVGIVTPDDISEMVKSLTGIPVVYGEDLPNLERDLKGRIKGQDHVVEPIARKIRKAYRGLRNPKKPQRFVFLGPPGVGKTELARVLNDILFGGSRESLTRIDMSEYQEQHTVSKLIGTNPGFVGYEQEGKLTGPVRKKPFQVVLLDEIGKAHPDVHQLLLQIFEEGGITDGHGRWVDMRHVIFIMTDNAGSEKEFAQRFGFAQADARSQGDEQSRSRTYLDALKALFSPAIRSRVADNVHVFRSLGREDLKATLELRVAEFNRHIAKAWKGTRVRLTDAAKDHLVAYAGTDQNQELGPARQLLDATWEQLGDALFDADKPVGSLHGKPLLVDLQAGKLVARIDDAPAAPEEPSTLGGTLALGAVFLALVLPAQWALSLLALGVGAFFAVRFVRGMSPAGVRLSLGYRLRKAARAGLAAALSVLPGALSIAAPRLPVADRQALIERFRRRPPKLVLLDWDGTFIDNRDKLDRVVTDDRIELLRKYKRKGIRVAFVTNRPLTGGDWGMMKVLFSRLDPELRADFILANGGGSEVYRFGPNAEVPIEPVRRMAVIEAEHRAAMQTFLRAEAGRLGLEPSSYREQNDKAYEYSFVPHIARERAIELYEGFSRRFHEAGFYRFYDARLKIPDNPKYEVYVRVRSRNAVKASGVRGILELLAADGRPVDARDVIIGGDEFGFGEDDDSMAEALPGAVAFAVGGPGHANVRRRNLHLLGDSPDDLAAFLDEIVR